MKHIIDYIANELHETAACCHQALVDLYTAEAKRIFVLCPEYVCFTAGPFGVYFVDESLTFIDYKYQGLPQEVYDLFEAVRYGCNMHVLSDYGEVEMRVWRDDATKERIQKEL